MQTKHARALFYTAAVFNFMAVALLLPASGIAARLELAPLADNGLFNQMALLAVFGFGAGYWMVARDPARNRAMVVIGLFLKLGVVALCIAHHAAGAVNLKLLVLIVGDLPFALAFFYFLTAYAPQRQRNGQ